jgi:hypothetical protein
MVVRGAGMGVDVVVATGSSGGDPILGVAAKRSARRSGIQALLAMAPSHSKAQGAAGWLLGDARKLSW